MSVVGCILFEVPLVTMNVMNAFGERTHNA